MSNLSKFYFHLVVSKIYHELTLYLWIIWFKIRHGLFNCWLGLQVKIKKLNPQLLVYGLTDMGLYVSSDRVD